MGCCKDEVLVRRCKKGFIPNYLVWCGHSEVEPPAVGAKSNGNKDEDQMDEMITDIGRGMR
jgi:hypothetical protein